jgi:hypothetical protein
LTGGSALWMTKWLFSMTLDAKYSEHTLHIRSSSCDWTEEQYKSYGKTASPLVEFQCRQ